jgi:hypothetical protein
MPDNYDPGDTRHLARRTAAAQAEQHRITKAVGGVLQNAVLPVAKQGNARRIACYTPTGSFVGLIRPQRLLPRNTVAKAGGSKLIAAYDANGVLIGVVDPGAIEGLGKGESFSYSEDGQLVGIVGSDNVIRPVTPTKAPTVPDEAAVNAARLEQGAQDQRDQDAAAWVAASQPATPGSPPAVVAKASKRPPMSWEQATAGLRQLRLKLARERVAKANAFDTRNMGPRDEVIRLLDRLESVLKMGPPPKPKQPDAERYLREMGEAAIAMHVRKSGKHVDADPMLTAALTYAAMPPNLQAEVRKALSKTSMASRARARGALTAAVERSGVRKAQSEGPLCESCLKAGRHVHMVEG